MNICSPTGVEVEDLKQCTEISRDLAPVCPSNTVITYSFFPQFVKYLRWAQWHHLSILRPLYDIILFYKHPFLAIIQHRTQEQKGRLWSYFNFWSDTELADLSCPPWDCANCTDLLCCWVERAQKFLSFFAATSKFWLVSRWWFVVFIMSLSIVSY